MHILELCDNVLRQICHYLSGSDALNLSLSSRDFYSLAIHRVAVVVAISSRSMLRRLHQSLICNLNTPSRAEDIQSLTIHPIRIAARRESLSTSSSDGDRDEEVLSPHKVVTMLIDLFRSTHNLRRLTLDSVHTLLFRDARLGAALASLPRLSYAHLDLVSDKVLKAVGKTNWDLRVLALHSLTYFRYVDSYPDHDMTYSILLDTISKFPHLHTLKISRFRGGYVRDLGRHDTLPHLPTCTFPALRRLFIWNSERLATLDLIDRCPNLELLDVELNETDSEEITSRSLTSWPTIRSLRSSAPGPLHNVGCDRHVIELNTAEHFRITSRVSVLDPAGKDKIVVSNLVCLLRKVSPRWLQMWVVVGSTPMTFWNEVPAVAPRLRYLDLKVSMAQLRKIYANWLENIPDALRSLPLEYLRLHLLPMPPRQELWDDEHYRLIRDSEDRVVFGATKDEARELYDAAIATAATLPGRCARAIPTLRYFVLSAEGPQWKTLEDMKEGGVGEKGEVEDMKDEMNWYAPFEQDRWHCEDLASWTSWRVERGQNLCRLQHLTASQGKQLQRWLECILDTSLPRRTDSEHSGLYDGIT